MYSFSIDLLAIPAVMIFSLTLLLSLFATKSPILSAFIAFVKTVLFVTYFSVYFDGTHTFLDDITYLEGGASYLQHGVGVSTLFQDWKYVLAVAGGVHFLYILYNEYALMWFGNYYFAPVALNIVAVSFVAFLGARLAGKEFLKGRLSKVAFFLFFIFFPELVAWSTIMNGKDSLVLLLHIVLLTAVSHYFRGRIWKAAIIFFFASMLLAFLRFYIPVFFIVSILVSLLLNNRISLRDRLKYLLIGFAALAGLIIFAGGPTIASSFAIFLQYLTNPLFGSFKMLLSPIPFNTSLAYSFLDWPMVYSWLMFPLTVFGILMVYRQQTEFSFFLLVYFFTFLFFYGSFAELQGPRHRIQLLFAISLFQFLGSYEFLKILTKRLRRKA